MRRRSLVFAVLVVVVPLGIAACGVSNGGRGAAESKRPLPDTAQPTRKQFVARAKAICSAPDDTLPRDLSQAPTEKRLAIAMDVWSDVVRDLRKLEPPASEQARVGRMLTHFEDAIRAGRRASTVDDESALAVFAGLFAAGSRGATIAHAYGLDICSPIAAMPLGGDLSENEAYREAMLELVRQLEENDPSLITRP